MDYEQVYYVSDDYRGASRPGVVIDHRTRPTTLGTRVITAAPPAAAPGTMVAALPAAPPYQYPQPPALGPAMVSQGWWGYPTQPGYVMPAPTIPGSNLASILGGFGDVGSLANIIAQVFAALLPLPAAPTPQDGEGDAAVNAQNNSSNLIRYQNALALFARRDQQILTLGSVLKELFKRPGTVV